MKQISIANAVFDRSAMNIELNWKRRAVIILAGSLAFLSIALANLAIRDAERGRLLAERAIEEEQRRCTGISVSGCSFPKCDIEKDQPGTELLQEKISVTVRLGSGSRGNDRQSALA